ncbi:MAG: hypothetical protein WD294_06615 [Phycisphaeraceae bacterium]
MSLLDKLERKYGRYGVPHVTEMLIGGQVLFIGVALSQPDLLDRLALSRDALAAGELWRLVTFLLIPPSTNILFAVIAWFIFYLFGSSLEQTWGAFRYNVYLLLGYVATVLAALFLPLFGDPGLVTNHFLGLSVFLAFAYLNPNFTILLFFIIPVKVKWLALISWVFVGAAVLAGPMGAKLAAVASVANFLIFFSASIVRSLRGKRRESVRRMEAAAAAEEPFHRCTSCGATDKSDPDLEFRYCPTCAGSLCYCEHHIFDHEHVREEENAQ